MPPITDPMALQQIAQQQGGQPPPPNPMPQNATPMSSGLGSIPMPPVPVRRPDPLDERKKVVEAQQAEAELPANIQEKQANATLATVRAANEQNIPWDDGTVDFVAHALAGGAPITQITGGFGMGSSGRINQTKVIERLAQIQGTKGLSGEDQARQAAHYKAGSAALANSEKQFLTIQGSEATTRENMENYLNLSQHLPLQTGSPVINSVIQGAQSQLPIPGHDDVKAMNAAQLTGLNEYARIMSNSPTGTGVLSDTARDEAQQIMKGNFTISQKQAVWKLMQADMANRIAGTRGALDQAYVNLTKTPGYTVPSSLAQLPASGIDAATLKHNEELIRSIYQNESTGASSGNAGIEPSAAVQAKAFPMAYQVEHNQFINQNRGTLTPSQYIAFRNLEDKKYGVNEAPLDQGEVEKFVKGVNAGNTSTAIPDQTIPTGTIDRVRAEAGGTPLGVGLAKFGNAMAAGIPEAFLSDEQKKAFQAAQDANPKASLAGELGGSIAGMNLLERGGAKVLSKVAEKTNSDVIKEALADPTTRQKLLGDVAVNSAYGGARGANAADEGQGTEGAVEGALGGAAGAGIGNFATKGLNPLLSKGAQDAISQLRGVKTTTLQKLSMGQGEAAISDLPVIKGAREKSLQSFNTDNANRALANIKGEGGQSLGITVPNGLKSSTDINAYVTDKLGEGFNTIKPKVVGAVDGAFEKEINDLKGLPTPKTVSPEQMAITRKLYEHLTGEKLPENYTPSYEEMLQGAQTSLRERGNFELSDVKNKGETLPPAVSSNKKDMWREVNAAIRLLSDENGHYNGDSYQAAQTKLRSLVQDFSTAAENNGDTAAREMAGVANDTRKAVRDLVARQTPAVAQQIKGLEQGWAHKMRIEDATLRALKANNETYSPGQYLDAVKKLDFSKSRVAEGRGFDQDYALAAKQVMGAGPSKQFSIRDTGIATGLAAALSVGAEALHPAAIPTVGGLGTALYMPGVKQAVAAALLKRPDMVEHPITEEVMRRGIADAMRRVITGEK